MEKWKRSLGIIRETAEVFDIPEDLAGKVPHVELLGNRNFYMENHRGILSYSGEEISVNGQGMVVRVIGSGLELESMTTTALRIRGTIDRVEWVV